MHSFEAIALYGSLAYTHGVRARRSAVSAQQAGPHTPHTRRGPREERRRDPPRGARHKGLTVLLYFPRPPIDPLLDATARASSAALWNSSLVCGRVHGLGHSARGWLLPCQSGQGLCCSCLLNRVDRIHCPLPHWLRQGVASNQTPSASATLGHGGPPRPA